MAYAVFTKESDTWEWLAHGPNDLRTLRMKSCVVLDSSQSNNASWKPMNSSDKVYHEEQVSESVLTKLVSLMSEA
jgi:hypothetical protein